MTALTQYKRLECTGLWRDDPADQRREVVVHLGEATLVLSDPRTDVALSHWSLPAVSRLSPGMSPAIYSPGPDSRETLELDDPDMIAALEKVHAVLKAAVPRPGRLRAALVAGVTTSLVVLGVFWVPRALVAHTASVLPPAKQAEIGQMALEEVIPLTGAPCTERAGLVALAALSERLFGPRDTPIVYVMRDGIDAGAHLPGQLILGANRLLTEASGPEAFAGVLLTEAERAAEADPVTGVLWHGGLVATFRLLTTGDLPKGSLSGYGEVLLATAPIPLAQDRLLARFSAAGVPVGPYAATVLAEGPERDALTQADPLTGTAPEPLMSDADWLALQAICGG